MEYPLFIDGVERGKLRMQAEGLYTVFEAELAAVQEGIYRLWLHGEGECAYLGIMQPWSGGMYLRRKFSRSELKNFPQKPKYASNENDASLHNNAGEGQECMKENIQTDANLHNNNNGAVEEAELLWFRRPDGSLVSFDGVGSLVALPVALRSSAEGAVLKRIEGRDYMIFRY